VKKLRRGGHHVRVKTVNIMKINLREKKGKKQKIKKK